MLEEIAVRDCLSGLLNRGAAEERFSLVSRAIADVDYFKQINDQYGHDVGDQVLVALSAYLKTDLTRK